MRSCDQNLNAEQELLKNSWIAFIIFIFGSLVATTRVARFRHGWQERREWHRWRVWQERLQHHWLVIYTMKFWKWEDHQSFFVLKQLRIRGSFFIQWFLFTGNNDSFAIDGGEDNTVRTVRAPQTHIFLCFWHTWQLRAILPTRVTLVQVSWMGWSFISAIFESHLVVTCFVVFWFVILMFFFRLFPRHFFTQPSLQMGKVSLPPINGMVRRVAELFNRVLHTMRSRILADSLFDWLNKFFS